MTNKHLAGSAAIAAMVLLGLLPSRAATDTFTLRNGTVVTGDVVRKTGSSLTLKHDSGVATYQFDELDAESRDRYFSQLQQMAAKERRASRGRTINARTAPWRDLTPYRRVQRACFVAGGIAVIVAELWFIVAAFSASPGWGVLILLFGGLRSVTAGACFVLFFLTVAGGAIDVFPRASVWVVVFIGLLMSGVGLLFIIRHWKRALGPVTTQLIGIGLLVIYGAMEAIWGSV